MVTLRWMLPIVIGVFSLVTTATSYLATKNAVLQATELSVVKNLRNSLTRAQGSLELLVGVTEQRSARQLVASYSAVPDTIVAFVADANGHIIASTLHRDIGHHWADYWSDIEVNKMETVLDSHTLDIHTSSDKGFVDGYVSICHQEENNLRKKNCGFFVHRIDLEYHFKKSTSALTNQAIYNSLGVIFIAILISIILHTRFVRRANKVAEVVTSFTQGSRAQRTHFRGTDEISVIAQTVDSMLDQIVEDESIITGEKNRLKILFDTVSDPLVISKENGKILGYNKALQTVFGYDENELKGCDLFTLMPDLYIADTSGSKRIFKGLINRPNQEMVAVRKDSERFPVEFVINEMEVRGRTEQITVLRDITERKAAEEEIKHHRDNLQLLVERATAEIKAIVRTAVNGVISINQDGIVQIFNPAAEKLFGWKAEEVVGENVVKIIPDIGTKEHNGFIQNYIQGGDAKIVGIGREVLGLRKDGSTFPAQLSVGHNKIGKGKHLFVAFIDDITERKLAEQELLQAKETAEEAAQVKASFLANMSHEIRTPMNAIIGFSEILLQDKKLRSESKQHVNTILTSGRNLLHIINDILDFSKIEAGQIQLENVCFHLANAIKETLRTLEFKAAEKDLKLSLYVAANVPEKVMGDPTRLRQVLINLIGNAIKFTATGTIMVRIALEENTNMLLFSVSDTGIGMTPEQTSNVFEAFAQADSSTNRRFGGTGLGTTISKQIVELMGGKIWAESEVNKGSTFYFTTSMEEAAESQECLFEETTNANFDFCSPRAFNILLAEDIPANAKLASLRLEQQGHSITWVENGLQAVEEALTGKFDIILMDIQMPELDGLEATRQIRSHGDENVSNIPIIALTASMMKDDQSRCFSVGMNNVIGKPVDFPELLSNMESLVPEGKGKIVEASKPVESADKKSIDFSVLHGIVDYETGIKTWSDAEVYTDALIDFGRERADNAIRITQLLESTSNFTEARKICHALKGLAGNLCITQVESEAQKLDEFLRSKLLQESLLSSGKLDVALRLAQTAISGLTIPECVEKKVIPKETLNSESFQKLLHEINEALDELNPDAVTPLLNELSKYTEESEVVGILNSVNSFDFYTAKDELKRLAERFGLSDI